MNQVSKTFSMTEKCYNFVNYLDLAPDLIDIMILINYFKKQNQISLLKLNIVYKFSTKASSHASQ